MPVAEVLVDSTVGHEYLSMLDGYSGYNQIFITEEDVPKMAFRCPGALGAYEWVVMPFGLKNARETYHREMNLIFHVFIETLMQIYIDDIVIKFGIPETVTTDQGSVFIGRKMQEFAKEMGFKLLTSMPYYAQANGQVEAANKVINGLIKKHVGEKPRNWHKTLDQISWACRTSPKEATNSTPLRLTFGHDAFLLVEIYLQSTRIQRHHEIPSESYWNMMLDELVDLDEETLNALELLKCQKKRVENSYNKKVKIKTFSPEDLVWKVVLPMDRKDRTLGKWSPKWEGPFQILKVFSNGAFEIEELSEDKRILRVNGKYLKRYRPTLQEIKIRNG
ncbi:uncharacterized protein LOC127081468 [Lathyrus oleraceus]|uniref:uncharacterized protein LOC127081468 n=1 Tax=Pisum sativum TaxID=3888 RepID=UPI0021D15D49|nr:uncharacterized protein LOC127081468 [Pisum sativum]